MGNGFVAGQVQPAGQMLRGLNGFFFHAKILARCLSRFRAPPIHAKSTGFPLLPFSPLPPLGPVLSDSFSRSTPCTTRRNLAPSRCVLLGEENCHVSPQHFYSSRRQSRHLVRRTLSRKRPSRRHSPPSRARRACAGCPAIVQLAVSGIAADGPHQYVRHVHGRRQVK